MISMRNKSVRAESTHNTWIMRILFERKTGTLITYILIKFSISFIISGKLETIWFVQSRLCIFTTYSNIQTIFILKDRLERFAAKGPNSQDFIEPKVQGLWKIAVDGNFTAQELGILNALDMKFF